MQDRTQINAGKAATPGLTSQSIDQCLTFVLGAESYGIDILRVQEIRGWEKTTNLPSVPDYVKGVINIRGAVVPIVDLRDRFEIGQATYDDTTVVIIVKMEVDSHDMDKTVGLVVDAVSDVEDIDFTTLQDAPSFQSGERLSDDFIHGLASLEDKMVIVLNVNKLLNQGIFQRLASEKLSTL